MSNLIVLKIWKMLLIISIAGCTVISPGPDHDVDLWKGVSNRGSIARKIDENKVYIKCDSELFNNFICVEIQDYIEQINYVEKLKNTCFF